MGRIINRRRVMGGEILPPYLKGYTLIHHWEADDWTVSTNWVDRVGGLVFQTQSNPIKKDGLIRVKGQSGGYFYLSPNANAAAPKGINMGSLWVVEVEGMVYDTGKVQWVADFGSVTTANHAFCPFRVANTDELGFNPKFTGNNSAALYNKVFDFTPYYGKLVKATIGTKEIDSDTVLPFYVLEGEIQYSSNTLTKAQALFNRNFDTPSIYVGKSVIADNTDYVYIKSIKIYTKYQ